MTIPPWTTDHPCPCGARGVPTIIQGGQYWCRACLEDGYRGIAVTQLEEQAAGRGDNPPDEIRGYQEDIAWCNAALAAYPRTPPA
jgi:hypothetical protein